MKKDEQKCDCGTKTQSHEDGCSVWGNGGKCRYCGKKRAQIHGLCKECCPCCNEESSPVQDEQKVNNPAQPEWEEEFEKEFCDEDRPDWITGTQRAWRVKDFIRNLLNEAREKEKERIVKICEGRKKKIDKSYSPDERRYPHGYNQALKEIVKELKSL